MKKLLDPEEHVSLFLQRATGLGRKLQIVLFQLPPFWRFNCGRLEALCQFIQQQSIVPGLRAALEVRHPSWLGETCFGTLRAHNVALAFTDWPSVKVLEPRTADFVFVRRHGPEGLYASDYSDALLQADAEQIARWRAQNLDVYVYFNNDVQGFAVRNAVTLKRLVGA